LLIVQCGIFLLFVSLNVTEGGFVVLHFTDGASTDCPSLAWRQQCVCGCVTC